MNFMNFFLKYDHNSESVLRNLLHKLSIDFQANISWKVLKNVSSKNRTMHCFSCERTLVTIFHILEYKIEGTSILKFVMIKRSTRTPRNQKILLISSKSLEWEKKIWKKDEKNEKILFSVLRSSARLQSGRRA